MSYIQNSILVEITNRTKTTLKPVAQSEIAHLMNLDRRISRIKDELKKQDLLTESRKNELDLGKKNIETVIYSLLHKDLIRLPVVLSKNLRYELEYSLNKIENPAFGKIKNLCLRILRLPSAKTKVIIGLVLAVPFCIGLSLTVLYQTKNIARATLFKTSTNTATQSNVTKENQSKLEADIDAYAENISLVVLAGSVGALGSIISILTRIKEYDYDSENYNYEDYFLPFLVGLFKPAIGAGFGILILAIIEGGILPLKVESEPIGTKQFFYISVAFIMGFSERFAQDLVNKVAGSITNEDKDLTVPPAPNAINLQTTTTQSSSSSENNPLEAIQGTQNKKDIETSSQSTSISIEP